MKKISLYIHWPFCKSKCPYCDFNSHVRDQINYHDWLNAYLNELNYFSYALSNKYISSIFFGGGTPSLMPGFIISALLDKISAIAVIDQNTEITMEANPTSVEIKNFKDYRLSGVNRISLGIQSLNENDLKFLGREHNKNDALKAINLAREIFPRYSFDLIYARANQTLDDWQKELTEALSYAEDHISLYQLTIEKGTKFFNQYKKGAFTIPDEELAIALYNITSEITTNFGLLPYEISNYAKKGAECRHNLAYWQYDEYLGIGPGAHSRINNEAIMMIYNPENWLNSVKEKGHAIQQQISLSKNELLDEILLMGLRLKKGIKREKFFEHFQQEPEKLLDPTGLNYLINNGLIILDPQSLRTTNKGLLLLNNIIAKLSP